MTPITLARTIALVAAALGAVHAVVGGMAAMSSDPGEAPIVNWATWWTLEGLSTSVAVQLRVGVTAALLGSAFLTVIWGVSVGTRRALIFLLSGTSVIGAILLETIVLSSMGIGPSRAEVNTLLGSFAHNGLSVGSAVAVSHWVRFAVERRFPVAHDARTSGSQAR